MTCQICFEDKQLIKGPYKCKTDHFFCQECIHSWNQRQNNCPICRSESIYNPLSNIELIHSWQILSGNRNIFTVNSHYPIILNASPRYTQRRRLRRSRSEILTVLAALDSFDADDIQIHNYTIQPELLTEPREPENQGILEWIFQCCRNILHD